MSFSKGGTGQQKEGVKMHSRDEQNGKVRRFVCFVDVDICGALTIIS